jgi:hypothetical protein
MKDVPERISGRAWFLVAAIVFAGAFPGFIFNKLIAPAAGLYPATCMFCGYETAIMVALGFVGASAGGWRFTIVGVLVLVPVQIVGDHIYHVVSRATPTPGLIPTWEDLKWWSLYAVVHFIPAAISHKVTLWAQRGPKRGHCVNCDYDLTGNTSGRCPECGTPTPRLAKPPPNPAA